MYLFQRHRVQHVNSGHCLAYFSRVYGGSTVITCFLVGETLYYTCILQIGAWEKSKLVFRAAPEKLTRVVLLDPNDPGTSGG